MSKSAVIVHQVPNAVVLYFIVSILFSCVLQYLFGHPFFMNVAVNKMEAGVCEDV